MRPSALLRYALSDLRHRAVTSGFNVAAVALAAVYVLVLGSWGASIHRYQRRVLEATLPTRIVAEVGDVTDDSARFTAERVAALEQLEGVAIAFPRVEINVRLGLDGARTIDLPAVGTLPEDPALAVERMAWGGPVSDAEASELVLSRALYVKLGGLLEDGAPRTRRAVVEVGRTVEGREERQRVELALAGMLEHEEGERAHVALERLRELNLWCRNRIADLGVGREAPGARHPHAYAYAPLAQLERVAAEAGNLAVEVEGDGELEVLRARGGLWARLERQDGAPLAAQDLAAVRGWYGDARVHGSVVRGFDGAQVVALGAADPRLEGLDPAALHALNEVGARALAAPLARELPLAGDAVTGRAGFRRLFFVPEEASAAEPYCLLEAEKQASGDDGTGWPDRSTQRLDACVALARLPEAEPMAGEEFAWVFLRATGRDARELAQALQRLAQREAELRDRGWGERALARQLAPDRQALPAALRRPGLALGAWAETRADWQVARPAAGPLERAPARVVPRALLDGLAGPPALALRSLPERALWAAAAGEAPARQVRALGRELELAGEARVALRQAEMWIERAAAGERGTPRGIVLWGSWRDVLAAIGVLGAGWRVEAEASRLPSELVALLPGEERALRARLDERILAAARLTPFRGVRVHAGEATPRTLVLASATALGAVPAGAVHGRARAAGGRLTLGVGAWSSEPLRYEGFRDLPAALAIVPELVFHEAAWAATPDEGELTGERRHDLRFEDPLGFLTASAELEAYGLALRPLQPLERERLARLRVRDPRDPAGRVGDDLVAVLAMTRPTFVAATAGGELEGRLAPAQEPLVLVATEPLDPRRFEHVPVAGTWVRAAAGANQVLLPGSLAGGAPRALLGRAVELAFTRQLGRGAPETLRIPLEVAGVVEGERAFAPVELLSKLRAWQEGKVLYNETRGRFESPLEVEERAGAVRCNVYARTAGEVAPVVAALRRAGYRTEDSLGAQRGLERLGRVLAAIVVVFVLGCLVNASITVFVATMMNVKSKIYEIGILRAHGLRRRAIVGIFAAQGLTLGALAFLAAALCTWALEPRLRALVQQVFGLEQGTLLAGSPFDARWWWLAPAAFLIAVTFSLGGVVFPAFYANSLSPVEALRRRE